MANFNYSVKGTADKKPNVGVIEADDQDHAMAQLKVIYGDSIKIKIISASEFRRLEAQNNTTPDDQDDVDLTHRPAPVELDDA